jgi:hypothetical protein
MGAAVSFMRTASFASVTRVAENGVSARASSIAMQVAAFFVIHAAPAIGVLFIVLVFSS